MAKRADKPASDAEVRAILEILRRHRLPPGVEGPQLEFGEDSTGNPAVWLWFKIDEDLNPSDQKVSALNEFVRSVTADLLERKISRWPYVRFRVAA
jgi:hypothetical protein